MTMPTPYFATPERIAALDSAASAWLGTPYVQSGAVRGNGASCHRLADAVLVDSGYPMPPVPERGAIRRAGFVAAMLAWFESHPEHFAPVPLDEMPVAGDLLVADLGCGHIGLCLGGPGPRILQVLFSAPAHYATYADPRLRACLRAIYRPLEVVELVANSAAQASHALDLASGYSG